MLEVKNVSKEFTKKSALKNVNLVFEDNKIYGLLGRNGAGKTTLINIITNKIFPSSGEVLLDGVKTMENTGALEHIFCMTEKSSYPADMKVKSGFYWTKELHDGFDIDCAYDLAKKFELPCEKRIRALSTGYQSIFKLILALASDASVIILDEPVLGLDANFRKTFYEELIKNYIEKPRTIIVSTHLIEEVANILEDVIIIEEGEILINEPVEKILDLAYNVSGSATNVDSYIKQTKSENSLINTESIGAFKVATIYEKRSKENEEIIKKLNLEITSAKLQDLFVAVTNGVSKKITENV